jgi:hypothetical protein
MEDVVSLKKEDLKHLEGLGIDMGIPVRVGAI